MYIYSVHRCTNSSQLGVTFYTCMHPCMVFLSKICCKIDYTHTFVVVVPSSSCPCCKTLIIIAKLIKSKFFAVMFGGAYDFRIIIKRHYNERYYNDYIYL